LYIRSSFNDGKDLVFPDAFADDGLFNGLILLGDISKRTTPVLLAFFIKATTSKKSV
jgi:hypothetical protein